MQRTILGSVLGFAVAVACLDGCAAPQRPVGELAADPQVIELGYPEFARIRLKWNMLADLQNRQGEARVFVHVEDQGGKVVRTFDHDLPLPWRPGDRGEYDVVLSQSALVAALPDGRYEIVAGLYDAAGNRWPLAGEVEEVRPGEYRLATLATNSAVAAPEFYFSSTWLPVEEGTDQQVLGRRRLGESGSLRVDEIASSGELWLRIGIPRLGPGERMMLDEGAVVPSVRIATECGGYEAEIAGSGSHEVVVPLERAGSGLCDLGFSANYYILSADGKSRQTLVLEGIAWSGRDGDPAEVSD